MQRTRISAVVAVGALWALGGAAHAQKPTGIVASRYGGSVKVLFGTTPLPASSPSRQPYKDARDSAICIAPESLKPLGVQSTVENGVVKLLAPDKSLLVLPARQGPFERSGGVFIDAVEAVKALGATVSFDVTAETLTIRATLSEVTLENDTVRVKSWLPVAPRLLAEKDGRRILIDFPGTSVGELPRLLPLNSGKVLEVQSLQLDDATARLIVDLSEPYPVKWAEARPSVVATFGPPTSPLVIAAAGQPASLPEKPSLPTKGAVKPPPTPMTLRQVQVAAVADDRLRLQLDLSRQPAVRPVLSKNRLTLDFGNATAASEALASVTEAKHPLLKAAQLVPVGEKAVRLVLELTETVAFTLKHSLKGALILDVMTPRKTEGPLVGRTIVVDPGHGGGSSTGNRGDDGILEKRLTLPIGLMVAEQLEAMGANVVLTRDSDFDPGLHERAYIANRVEADLFVSVHLNDGRPNRSVRGTEVYYHNQEPNSRDLAKFIGAKVKSTVGEALPLRGALSDYRLYPGDGLAVLRCSQMASVLVEVGYMSNSADYAAMKKPEVQANVARGIAEGVADYLAANPEAATRFVKPQPTRDSGLPPLDITSPPSEIK